MKYLPTSSVNLLVGMVLIAMGSLRLQAQGTSIQFSSMSITVRESSAFATITVSRTGDLSQTNTVDFSTAEGLTIGTALPSVDYFPTNGSLEFPPTIKTRSFTVGLIDDSVHEGVETVTLELSNPGGATLGTNNATVLSSTLFIADNDPCLLSIAPTARTVGADGGTVGVRVDATEGCGWAVESAAPWLNFHPPNGTGHGELLLSYDPNTTAGPRTGIVKIVGQGFSASRTLKLTQNGVFAARAGAYNGLLAEDAHVQHATSGFFTARVGVLGAFTARLTLGSRSFPFSGRFGLDGLATNRLTRPGTNDLVLVLTLDLRTATDQLTGSLDAGAWQGVLTADRAFTDAQTNAAPQAGAYVLRLPGEPEQAGQQPGGDSIGTVTVNAKGSLTWRAQMADGTSALQKVPLSRNGDWPLYARFHTGQGSLLGWVRFASAPDQELSGSLTWTKPPLRRSKLYPSGFAIQPELSGSRYRPPTNRLDRVLALSTGQMEFTAGNLTGSFTNLFVLGDNNTFTNLSTNTLSASLDRSTGLLRGKVRVPQLARTLAFKAVLDLRVNSGAGFFLGTNESGRVRLTE